MLFGGFRPADNSNDVRDDGEGFRANALVDPGKEAARRMAAIKPEDRISFMMLEYFSSLSCVASGSVGMR